MSTLVVTEARLLLRMWALWTAVVLTVALCAVWSGAEPPTWAAWTSNSGMASLVLAAFLLIAGHLAASRDRRHGATEAMTVLPAPAPRRSAALLAIVPVAFLLATLAVALELLILTPRWPAGTPDPWSLPAAVVIPMLGAALGLAVGRWLPSTAAGPLTLFGCTAILALLPVLGSSPNDLLWAMFPVVLDADVTATGWHLTYLLALLTAAVAMVLLRHWRVAPAVLVLLAVGGSVVAVQQQVAGS